MQRLICCFVLFVQLFALVGCSGDQGTSDSNPIASSEVTPLPEFTDANEALAVGSNLLETGETDKAIEVLNQAVKLNPDLAEAYFKLGIAYALTEKRDEAAVETVVTPTPEGGRKKPRELKTNSEIAFEKAVDAYKKMLDTNPENAVAHFNLGRSYNKLNEDQDAAKSLREAVKLNPEDTEYQTELGAILVKLAQYREAIEPLKKALELDPSNSRAEELLADAEAGRKRIDFTPVNKDTKKNLPANANSNVNSLSSGNSKTSASPQLSKPQPTATKP